MFNQVFCSFGSKNNYGMFQFKKYLKQTIEKNNPCQTELDFIITRPVSPY